MGVPSALLPACGVRWASRQGTPTVTVSTDWAHPKLRTLHRVLAPFFWPCSPSRPERDQPSKFPAPIADNLQQPSCRTQPPHPHDRTSPPAAMFGAFRFTNPLSSGLLWKTPWRLSKFQKRRQRLRLRAVDSVVATLDSALAKKGETTKSVERWKAEMPKEEEMRAKDKYTIFDRKEKRYRKGIHSTCCQWGGSADLRIWSAVPSCNSLFLLLT